ncbi:Predicted DNA-binding transcriptional regulator YafY, contains an HTH and WYL domains [Prosthecobacter debontii]|uniref:Predicted DNA-binding transcriptional regulator YafY, contains an HTH and WYL domains n=1 Tax=Prosthecobacter debontii TaxID=48467 RepID=A0A1T4Z1C5_9BACT|nr:YafY family protein [Prosthecobacter debontii]SKB07618.1 Predicted DNA-binding transcriptional regulator YafY, contains an HTH and WYL domains [Prosthecobacter debontii]
MNRIDRLTGMILLLQSHRVITAEQIAAHFEMSMRTVYRDLAALGEAGVPIVAEAGVGYSLMRGYHMPPVMFTEQEAAALFMSGEVTEQIADDTLRGALRSALLKVRAVLPKERQDQLNRLKHAVGVWLNPRSKEDNHRSLMPLQQAVAHRRCVSMAYNAGSKGVITSRIIEPLGMMFYAREWHLIAFCRLRQEFRDFRLDRMVRWEVLTERFMGHENFSVKAFLESSLNEHAVLPTTVCFAPESLDRVRREMSCPDVKEEVLPDGRVRMEMLAYSQEWLVGWLMSFGRHVEVLHPPELRQQMRDMALHIASRHEA